MVRFEGKWWGNILEKMQILYKIFGQNKMLCRLTMPIFFSELKRETHIIFFFCLNIMLTLLFEQKIFSPTISDLSTIIFIKKNEF